MPDDLWIPIAILATYVTMLLVERVAAARPFSPRPGWAWVGWGFLLLLFAINGVLPELLPMAWIAEHALLPGHRLGVAGGVVAGVLAFTLVDYWIHRALHRFNALWRAIHQVHHGAERVDIYGSAVLHPVEIALFVVEGIFVNVFVLGLDPRAVAIAGYLGAFMAMFQHWNIRTPRWLGFLIQRPESHCLHHERHVHGRNYSNRPAPGRNAARPRREPRRSAARLPRARTRRVHGRLNSGAVHLHQLQSGCRTAFDRHRRTAAREVARDEADQFFVRLAVHRWRLQLREPDAVGYRLEAADARPGLHLHADHDRRHADPATAKTSTDSALPLNGVAPRASSSTPDPTAAAVAASSRIARPATLVCASRRAARFTVSPMQV
jgi:fumarate reductase subunit D